MKKSKEISYGTKEKPKGLKLANPSTFLDKDGKIIPDITYYIHTFHTDRWEDYKTSELSDLKRLEPFLIQNRVYVLVESLTQAKTKTGTAKSDDKKLSLF